MKGWTKLATGKLGSGDAGGGEHAKGFEERASCERHR
jgi:hypothetical protein